jgi:BirA family transcriptional regulator, biotin operon repressor / biotin---[acetyl-CoA-carboxylase] ligase
VIRRGATTGQSRDTIGREVRCYPEVSSTNDLAMAAAQAGEREGLVIVAETQTAGRGRSGRSWHAPAGTCLLLSVLFRPSEPFPYSAVRTTMACGLALRDAVEALAGDPPAFQVKLKWPNDLIVISPKPGDDWAKLAGMLTEVCLDEVSGGEAGQRATALVIGIGLNVNVDPSSLRGLGPNATSLSALTGRDFDRSRLMDELLTAIDHQYGALLRGVDPHHAWQAGLAWIGEVVEARGPRETLVGVAEGVDSAGALLLRTGTGQLRTFTAGDVSLRRR